MLPSFADAELSAAGAASGFVLSLDCHGGEATTSSDLTGDFGSTAGESESAFRNWSANAHTDAEHEYHQSDFLAAFHGAPRTISGTIDSFALSFIGIARQPREPNCRRSANRDICTSLKMRHPVGF